MNTSDPGELDRSQILALPDSLVIMGLGANGVDMPFIVIVSGGIYGFNGHVDMGTGIRTSLAQIVAEELDVPFERVTMVLGGSRNTPDQGATIASATIQVTAQPLRQAAAQARLMLLAVAAQRFNCAVGEISTSDGVFHGPEGAVLELGALLAGQQLRAGLDNTTPVKNPSQYRVVGKAVARVDIPAKATGTLTFVHDMRVPGMLHGRMIRPPYAGVDHGPFVGTSLIGIDRDSIAQIPGVVDIVTIGDFIGVVAEREEQAMAAAAALVVHWKKMPQIADLADIAQALRNNPSTARLLQDKGDLEAARAAAPHRLKRQYLWPYHMHGSIGPSCAVADYRGGSLTVWSGTQNPLPLRGDLAKLLGMAPEAIDIVRMEAAGCYGRNCADDVTADAALLSRAVGRPVRVQLSREQEHVWEPKGTAQLIEIDGSIDAEGNVAAYEIDSRYPSNGAPTLALLLTGVVSAIPDVLQMGDRTIIAPYDYPAMRATAHDMAPIVRASWLRGVSALPNSFAHDNWIDEAAALAGVDPLAYRLRYMTDERGIAVLQATAERAGWEAHVGARRAQTPDGRLKGRGLAYALYVHSKFPGYGAAWAAWVADITVDRVSGEVRAERVTVGQDTGLVINPAGVQHQIHGNVIQSTSRSLFEQVSFNELGVQSTEWGSYPIIRFPDVPEIDVLMIPRPDQPPRGAGESASVPSAAAIANALYDATGIRFRDPPFTPEKVRAALAEAGLLLDPTPQLPPPAKKRGKWCGWLAGAGALAMAALPWRGAIEPARQVDLSLYSPATLERGRQIAAAGACAVCHTAAGGVTNAGGHALETPFGLIYSTNITPDRDTGIGAWSLDAFTRAMREGVSRDGHLLYPAFPYTAYSKLTDADIEALYAYLMSQPAVSVSPPPNEMRFPFNQRPLLAGWNLLFHRVGEYVPDPARSDLWNRGAYLVQGAGHCGACHTPRNAMGAEKTGSAVLGGAMIDHWFAPALNGMGDGPVGWNEQDFYDYLSTGRSAFHGAAAGPMAPVIEELGELPEHDIRAMAHYLASLNPNPAGAELRARQIEKVTLRTAVVPSMASSASKMLYEGACASCHEASNPGAANAMPLGFSSVLHGERPDNLIQLLLAGLPSGAHAPRTDMPSFANLLTDQQMIELAGYLRARFSPQSEAWALDEAMIARFRELAHSH